jgi:hypothetical protein
MIAAPSFAAADRKGLRERWRDGFGLPVPSPSHGTVKPHPLGTERVGTAVQVRMQAAEGVFVLGVAPPASSL